MLTLSHIRKDYGKFTAVEDINLELENGLYAMLAPNGAGKTTLIKMITTLCIRQAERFYTMEWIFIKWEKHTEM